MKSFRRTMRIAVSVVTIISTLLGMAPWAPVGAVRAKPLSSPTTNPYPPPRWRKQDADALDFFIYLPLVMRDYEQINMPGLSFVPPTGWELPAPTTVPTTTTELTGTATTRLDSPDGVYFMEIIVDWFAPPPPEAIFGNFARPPLDPYQETISQLHTGEPVQILRATGTMNGSVFLLAHAAFRLAHGSYSLGLYGKALDEQGWKVFSDTLASMTPNLATLPPPIRPTAGERRTTREVSLTSSVPAQVVSYDRNAAITYAQTYVGSFTNSDGCYLWTDNSLLGCSYWEGAWGVDGAHFVNRALSAGGLSIPGLWPTTSTTATGDITPSRPALTSICCAKGAGTRCLCRIRRSITLTATVT